MMLWNADADVASVVEMDGLGGFCASREAERMAEMDAGPTVD